MHVRRVHDRIVMHVCDVCSRTFKSKCALDNHQLIHSDIQMPKLECPICRAQLKNNNSYRKHMHRHDDTKHTCELCDKQYPNRLALDGHRRYKHGERDQHCRICDKSFRKPIELKVSLTTL